MDKALHPVLVFGLDGDDHPSLAGGDDLLLAETAVGYLAKNSFETFVKVFRPLGNSSPHRLKFLGCIGTNSSGIVDGPLDIEFQELIDFQGLANLPQQRKLILAPREKRSDKPGCPAGRSDLQQFLWEKNRPFDARLLQRCLDGLNARKRKRVFLFEQSFHLCHPAESEAYLGKSDEDLRFLQELGTRL